MFYKNVWSDKDKFFCPRKLDGTFDCPKGIMKLNTFDNRYTEGDSWHYRFYVSHDTEGLIDLFGSEKEFVRELNKYFEYSKFDNITLLPNPYYWAGNEEVLFNVW